MLIGAILMVIGYVIVSSLSQGKEAQLNPLNQTATPAYAASTTNPPAVGSTERRFTAEEVAIGCSQHPEICCSECRRITGPKVRRTSSRGGSSANGYSTASNHTELTATFTCNNGPCNSSGGTVAPPRAEEQPPRHEAQSDPGPITAKRDGSVTAIITNTRVDY